MSSKAMNVNLRAVLAIVRKDAVEIVLNRSALITVVTPVFIALLFAGLNTLLSGKATRVLIYNPDNSNVERVIADSPLPNVQFTRAGSAGEVAAAFGGRANSPNALGLVVPLGYDAMLSQHNGPSLTLYINGDDVDSATGQLIAGALAGYTHAAANPSGPPAIAVVTVNPAAPNARPGLGHYLAMFGLVSSFTVGAAVVAGLLLEEKEKGTLRLLIVSPASNADVVAGKLVVGLGYQALLVIVVLAIQGGYVGTVWLVLLFGLLGSLLGLALGLLDGSLAKNTSAFGAFIGVASALYTLPALFVGPIGQALRDSLLVRVLQVFPTYFLAHGILDSMDGHALPGTALLDLSVVAGCVALVFGAALWSLRRESAL